jgi:hypothetical protein
MLLVGYHIEKTAGSALMKWLHKQVTCACARASPRSVPYPSDCLHLCPYPSDCLRLCPCSCPSPHPVCHELRATCHLRGQVNAPARLTCLFDYMTTNCFFALHPDLFPAFADAWTLERCGTLRAPNWSTSPLALEFHGYSKYRYWSIFGRQLPALRRKYAALGAPVITTTMVRDPNAHIVSSYLMWPPYERARDATTGKLVPTAVPLPAWLPLAVGLQVGSLTLSSSHQPKPRGWHNPLGCTKLAEARQRLASFDVVGVLECTSPLLLLLSGLLGWDLDEARLDEAVRQALQHRPHGTQARGTLNRGARRWVPARLNETTRAAVRAAASCDDQLYRDGRERMRRHLALAEGTAYAKTIHRYANGSDCAALLEPVR